MEYGDFQKEIARRFQIEYTPSMKPGEILAGIGRQRQRWAWGSAVKEMEFGTFMREVAKRCDVKFEFSTTPTSLLAEIDRKIERAERREEENHHWQKIKSTSEITSRAEKGAAMKNDQNLSTKMDISEFIRQLFSYLGVEADPNLTPEEALEAAKRHLRPIREKLVDEEVSAAIAADKLRPDEKDWAWGEADKGLILFRSFVKHRKPVHNALAARMDSASRPTTHMNNEDRRIAAQMGVSEELWQRHNGGKQ
jgi:hypothetical protein